MVEKGSDGGVHRDGRHLGQLTLKLTRPTTMDLSQVPVPLVSADKFGMHIARHSNLRDMEYSLLPLPFTLFHIWADSAFRLPGRRLPLQFLHRPFCPSNFVFLSISFVKYPRQESFAPVPRIGFSTLKHGRSRAQTQPLGTTFKKI